MVIGPVGSLMSKRQAAISKRTIVREIHAGLIGAFREAQAFRDGAIIDPSVLTIAYSR